MINSCIIDILVRHICLSHWYIFPVLLLLALVLSRYVYLRPDTFERREARNSLSANIICLLKYYSKIFLYNSMLFSRHFLLKTGAVSGRIILSILPQFNTGLDQKKATSILHRMVKKYFAVILRKKIILADRPLRASLRSRTSRRR